jgi:Fe-S-cluster-containing hydrogenase component 2
MRENIAIVKNDKCDGCGLCAVVCDFDAVEFVHTN